MFSVYIQIWFLQDRLALDLFQTYVYIVKNIHQVRITYNNTWLLYNMQKSF